MEQIYSRTPMAKCDFNKICCIFSEYLFLRTPLDGCFCSFDFKCPEQNFQIRQKINQNYLSLFNSVSEVFLKFTRESATCLSLKSARSFIVWLQFWFCSNMTFEWLCFKDTINVDLHASTFRHMKIKKP